MKFLVRGDCTSRRALMLNRARFDGTFTLVTNEKAPNAVFCDHLDGRVARPAEVEPFIDETKMAKSQLLYYRRQFERGVLEEKGASLLVIDPYSEMNFQLWRHRVGGWRFWVPKGAIKDLSAFRDVFDSEGPRSFVQAAEDTARVVLHIQSNNPGMPVLFLPQLLDLFPALMPREAFNDLGSALKERIPDLFVGTRVAMKQAVPEDLGTGGGPGLTLHYSGDTYWQCMAPAIEAGLLSALSTRAKVVLQNQPAAQALSGEPKRFSLQRHTPTCIDACDLIVNNVKMNLQEYFLFDDPAHERTRELRYRTALIDLDKYRDFNDFESFVKLSGKGNRIRLRKKAVTAGYYCKPFAWRLHIPDIHAINTSVDVRSGGLMRASSQKSVEEMGGAPIKPYPVVAPKCSNHWSQPWGVFHSQPGHVQGNQTTDERLWGYIFLRRFGECLVYSLIMGHHDQLNEGIMILLHHEVMRWVLESSDSCAQGLRVVMYGGYDQGTQGLRDWKRREAFEPYIVTATDQAS